MRATLATHYEAKRTGDGTVRDTGWQGRTEKALAGVRAELALATSVLRQQQEAQEAERARLQENKLQRAAARQRFIAEQQALKQAKAAPTVAQAHAFNAEFLCRAQAVLEPEIYQLLIDATAQVLEPPVPFGSAGTR